MDSLHVKLSIIMDLVIMETPLQWASFWTDFEFSQSFAFFAYFKEFLMTKYEYSTIFFLFGSIFFITIFMWIVNQY